MERIRSKIAIVVVILLFIAVNQESHAQADNGIRIKEYYWRTPLNKVLNDFQTKYGINIQYDSTLTAGYKFDDRGRYGFEGTTVQRAFSAICTDNPSLSFYIDENEVIHLETKVDKTSHRELANTKYKGGAEKTNIKVSGVIKDIESGELVKMDGGKLTHKDCVRKPIIKVDEKKHCAVCDRLINVGESVVRGYPQPNCLSCYGKQLPLIDTCSICLNTVRGAEEDSVLLPCNHLFHKSCMNRWNRGCPNCRNPVMIRGNVSASEYEPCLREERGENEERQVEFQPQVIEREDGSIAMLHME